MKSLYLCMFTCLLLAGCMATTPSEGDDLPNANEASPLGENVLQGGFVLDGCRGALMGSQVPSAWGDGMIPDGFRARTASSALLTVNAFLMDCARMVHNGTVRSDVRLFEGSIWVYKEEEGGADRLGVLVVESFTNDAVLGGVLARFGAEIQTASIEPNSALPSPTSVGWRVEGQSATFEFEFPELGVTQGTVSSEADLWYAGAPSRDVLFQATETRAEVVDWDAVRMSVDGTSPLARLFGDGGGWTFSHQGRWDAAYTYSFDVENGIQE